MKKALNVVGFNVVGKRGKATTTKSLRYYDNTDEQKYQGGNYERV